MYLSKLNPSTCASDSSLCHLHRDLILPVMIILWCIQALHSNGCPPFLQCYSSLISDFTTQLNLPKITNAKAFKTVPLQLPLPWACPPPPSSSMHFLNVIVCHFYFWFSLWCRYFHKQLFLPHGFKYWFTGNSQVFFLNGKLPTPTDYLVSHLDVAKGIAN